MERMDAGSMYKHDVTNKVAGNKQEWGERAEQNSTLWVEFHLGWCIPNRWLVIQV